MKKVFLFGNYLAKNQDTLDKNLSTKKMKLRKTRHFTDFELRSVESVIFILKDNWKKMGDVLQKMTPSILLIF